MNQLITRHFNHVQRQLQDVYQKLLTQDPEVKVEKASHSLSRLNEQLVRFDPIADRVLALTQKEEELHNLMNRALERAQSQFSSLINALDVLSPLSTLGRGYSLVSKQGLVISQAGQLQAGDEVELKFSQGQAQAQIIQVDS